MKRKRVGNSGSKYDFQPELLEKDIKEKEWQKEWVRAETRGFIKHLMRGSSLLTETIWNEMISEIRETKEYYL